MNEIIYTYVITNVDQAARCMEVVYSSEGRQTIHVGARLPYEGELLEDVIKAFAPVPFWREREMPVVAPPVGLSGTVVEAAPVLQEPIPAPTQP